MWTNTRNWLGKFLVGVAGAVAKHPEVIVDAARAVATKNAAPLVADVVTIVGDVAVNSKGK